MPLNWIIDRTKYLSRREVRLLCKASPRPSAVCKSQTVRARTKEWFLVRLGLESGLRVSEMADLICEDLRLSPGASVVVVRNGKGGKSRTVQVSNDFARSCRSFLQWRQRAGGRLRPDSPLLPGRRGEHATPRALQRAFKRVAARAGLPAHYSIHCLRHTYGTLLYEASGCDIRFVQQQLGHSSVSTTEIYAHVAQENARQSLKRLSRIYRENSRS